jgi:hypothetical protein
MERISTESTGCPKKEKRSKKERKAATTIDILIHRVPDSITIRGMSLLDILREWGIDISWHEAFSL